MDRIFILNKWGFCCGLCEKRLPVGHNYSHIFEIDHFYPRALGGSDSYNNLWPLCLECHRKKTQMEQKGCLKKPYCLICKSYYSPEAGHKCFENLLDKNFPALDIKVNELMDKFWI